MLLWTTLGVGGGLLAAIALSEWVGGVNPTRVRRAADRLRDSGPARLTPPRRRGPSRSRSGPIRGSPG